MAVSYTHLDVYKRQDYNSPFADAFRAVLPAGRSGSVELLLDLPADAQDLTVTWYRGEVSQELEILLP